MTYAYRKPHTRMEPHTRGIDISPEGGIHTYRGEIANRFDPPTDGELRELAARYQQLTGKRVFPKMTPLLVSAWRVHGPACHDRLAAFHAETGIHDLLKRLIYEPDVPPRPKQAAVSAGDPPAPIALPATPSPRTTDLLDGLDEEVEAAMPSYFASHDRKLDVPLGTHARAHAADVDAVYDQLPYMRDGSPPYDPTSTARYDRVACRAYRDHQLSHVWDADRWRCPQCEAA